jgi:hypothetical protein
MMRYRKVAKRVSKTSLSGYTDLARKFANYLEATAQIKMRISGVDLAKMQPVEHDMDYIHRWTVPYRKAVLSKFYQLETWLKDNPCPVTMMTLTGYQDGHVSRQVKGRALTVEDTFQLLNESWKKLSMILRKEIPDLTYVWIVEPHASGYPHYHVVLFHALTEAQQDRIRALWSEKYVAGSLEHGVDFSVRTPETSVRSMRNYLMKYVAKGFVSAGSRFEPDTEWTPEQLVFNAVAWKHGYRLFGCSRNLSAVMAYQGDTRTGFIWYKMEISNGFGDYLFPIWRKTKDEVRTCFSNLWTGLAPPGCLGT